MLVNGNALPEAFIRDIAAGRFKRDIGSWYLRENRDAYNNPLETELSAINSLEFVTWGTDYLLGAFEQGGYYGGEEDEYTPGYIPNISDMTQIVCFGMDGGGEPFCFDFRDGNEPSVIYWDDVYWRRIAPNYQNFVDLFDID